MDKTLHNNLLEKYPTIENAALAGFNYLFPNGFTTAYGDARHSWPRFNSLELFISNYRNYGKSEKEDLITGQLIRFNQEGAYSRENMGSLFRLFYYVEELEDIPAASSFTSMFNPTFYSPNVSWVVQRNGLSQENGMMVSKNASLGNHSHTKGEPGNVLIKQFRKGFEIDSSQPFIITIPISEKENGVLESINQDQNGAFEGKVIKQDKIRLATFQLPALNRVKFKSN